MQLHSPDLAKPLSAARRRATKLDISFDLPLLSSKTEKSLTCSRIVTPISYLFLCSLFDHGVQNSRKKSAPTFFRLDLHCPCTLGTGEQRDLHFAVTAIFAAQEHLSYVLVVEYWIHSVRSARHDVKKPLSTTTSFSCISFNDKTRHQWGSSNRSHNEESTSPQLGQ